jgi:hypothetical protein
MADREPTIEEYKATVADLTMKLKQAETDNAVLTNLLSKSPLEYVKTMRKQQKEIADLKATPIDKPQIDEQPLQ